MLPQKPPQHPTQVDICKMVCSWKVFAYTKDLWKLSGTHKFLSRLKPAKLSRETCFILLLDKDLREQ